MIDATEFKRLVKEAMQEALKEQANGATAPDPATFSPTASGYEEAFHQIMAEVARGAVDPVAAGKLIAANYQKHYGTSPEPNAPVLQDWLSGWEQELKGYSVQQTEKTLQMLDRMKAKLQARADEAQYHIEVKKIQEAETKAKAAANLQALKDKMSAGEK